jgi:hypothetical protein
VTGNPSQNLSHRFGLPLAQGAALGAVEDDELHADLEREVTVWGVWGQYRDSPLSDDLFTAMPARALAPVHVRRSDDATASVGDVETRRERASDTVACVLRRVDLAVPTSFRRSATSGVVAGRPPVAPPTSLRQSTTMQRVADGSPTSTPRP